MHRVVLVVLLAATVSGCKTGGLIPSKFEGGNWSVAERLSNLMELLVGAELNTAEARQEWFAECR
jgi:hypothetical protein